MQQLRLPQEKLSALLTALRHWYQRTSCKKREFLSLIGHLSHAAAVVAPGRTFLRHLIELPSTVHHLDHHIHLRARAHSDLMWWLLFVENWIGISYLPPTSLSQRCYSDASSSWGCGVYWQGSWFQLQWPEDWDSTNIAVKELVPIVITAAIWGSQWIGLNVLALCNNCAVVQAINARRAKDWDIMCLLHCSFSVCTSNSHCHWHTGRELRTLSQMQSLA